MVTNNKIQIINNKRIMINQVEVQILKYQIKELNPVAILKSHHSILILLITQKTLQLILQKHMEAIFIIFQKFQRIPQVPLLNKHLKVKLLIYSTTRIIKMEV
jgi:hypothetical protein